MSISPNPNTSTAGNPPGMSLSFDDEFNSLSLNTGTAATANGTWDTWFRGWNVRTLVGNSEQEIYVDPDYAGSSGSALGLNPFSNQNGVTTISASPTPAQDLQYLNNMPYVSGVLTTQNSFSQTYGYFEMRAELPGGGQGLWPAFWLMPQNNTWPPEIDVFEQVDSPTNSILSTIHDNSGNASSGLNIGDTSAAYHTYGVLWTSQSITFYVDGQKQFSTPTPADYNQPMYMLMNLAVGGSWPGSPDSTTNWAQAHMNVDYVRAYSLSDTAMAAPDTISTDSGTISASSGTASASGGSAATAATPPQTAVVPVSSTQATTSTSVDTTSASNGSAATASTDPASTSAGATSAAPTVTASASTGSVAAAPTSLAAPTSGGSSPSAPSVLGSDHLRHTSKSGATQTGGGGTLSQFLAGAHATIRGFHAGQDSVTSGGASVSQTHLTASQGNSFMTLEHSSQMNSTGVALGGNHVRAFHA